MNSEDQKLLELFEKYTSPEYNAARVAFIVVCVIGMVALLSLVW